MLDAPLAPYLLWAKSRQPAAIDLAGSNLLHCTLDDLPGAREAVDLWAKNDDGYRPLIDGLATHYGIAAERFVTANGCSGANFVTIAALVAAGDEVLIERPAYDPLVGACLLMGANVRRFERRFEDRYQIDLGDLAHHITPRTRLIVVTTPHNPSGAQLDRSALVTLGTLASRVGAHVLVDEVYLDAASAVRGEHGPALSAAHLDGPFIVTNSLTKSYGLAGLRLGWAIGTPPVAMRLRRTRDVIDNAGSSPADRLAALAVAQRARLSERARSLLGANLDLARRFLAAQPLLEVTEPPGSSVMFPRIRGCADAEPFVRVLLDEHGVAVAPGRFFEAPAHFRISLAGRTDALAAGLDAIARTLARWPVSS
ncbi:MAG TPA: pyridoxal phosphate-dependent aminotransferase [Vicinamibacterales bacterium]|nr:pyridoxal phosphate-dependent aminotransferase [Vicinamibacterales bacterium]